VTAEDAMFTARVRLYEPEVELPDGSMSIVPGGLEWHDVPYLEPVECEHVETMCRGCFDTWEIDNEVQRPNLA
jgi:hypothetical protein